MASPNTLALMRDRRALRSGDIHVTLAPKNGNRKLRRDIARELVKERKKNPVIGRNEKGELVIKEKIARSMSFHEVLRKVEETYE